MKSDLMKEVEENEDGGSADPEQATGALVGRKKGGSSDEDVVLVDADGPALAQGGSVKKRKGKK